MQNFESCLFHTLNDDLQNVVPSLSNLLKRLFGIFKLEAVRDELLRLHTATGHQVNSRRINTSLVSNRSSDSQVSDTSGSYREDDILSTRLALYRIWQAQSKNLTSRPMPA